ncbi:MAG: hypothetical protein M1292_08030, partial [Bacteroidetes bacterium]|nr:hypothetical protein [Bacteroidota bacterium]
EKEYLRDIEKLIAKKIPVAENLLFPLIDHNPVKAPKQQQGRGNSGHSRPKQVASKTPVVINKNPKKLFSRQRF